MTSLQKRFIIKLDDKGSCSLCYVVGKTISYAPPGWTDYKTIEFNTIKYCIEFIKIFNKFTYKTIPHSLLEDVIVEQKFYHGWKNVKSFPIINYYELF